MSEEKTKGRDNAYERIVLATKLHIVAYRITGTNRSASQAHEGVRALNLVKDEAEYRQCAESIESLL
jgi:hypothetical protein